MRWWRRYRRLAQASRALSLLLVPALALACGDDDQEAAKDAAPSPRDAGPPRSDAAVLQDGGAALFDPACVLDGCDLLDPGACGAGEGCAVALPDAGQPPQAVCLQVGSGAEGTSCDSQRDCAAGLHCVRRAGAGRCRRYCCEPSRRGGCPSDQFCGLELEDARGTPIDVFVCEGCSDCDVRDRDACAPGLGCYLLPELGLCRVCLAAGTSQPGEACTFSTDCLPGAACVRASDGERRCVEFCDLAAPACTGPRTCQAPAGAELPADTGLCL